MEGEEDFEAFIEFANCVEFDSADYRRLERVVQKKCQRRLYMFAQSRNQMLLKEKRKW
jgi:hypothetical protein